jgi:hypothetical protein
LTIVRASAPGDQIADLMINVPAVITPNFPAAGPGEQIVVPSPAPVETGSLNVGGWTIQVIGDAVFITCDGEVMTQTRTGKLDQKEIVVRRDPPAASNARPTEILK